MAGSNIPIAVIHLILFHAKLHIGLTSTYLFIFLYWNKHQWFWGKIILSCDISLILVLFAEIIWTYIFILFLHSFLSLFSVYFFITFFFSLNYTSFFIFLSFSLCCVPCHHWFQPFKLQHHFLDSIHKNGFFFLYKKDRHGSIRVEIHLNACPHIGLVFHHV